MKLATEPLGKLPPGMDPVDLAAWTVVANVLLNLDAMLVFRLDRFGRGLHRAVGAGVEIAVAGVLHDHRDAFVGGEGGTGAAPMPLIDQVGMPIREALPLVVNLRDEFHLRERVRIIASGKLVNPGDVAWAIASGADYVASARGFMFSIGCIPDPQALLPARKSTQSASRWCFCVCVPPEYTCMLGATIDRLTHTTA